MGLCCSKESEDCNVGSPRFELASGNVQMITTTKKWEEKMSEADRDGKIIVVNFSAAWCHPCRVITPAFTELADRYPSTMFLTVDVDELPEFSMSWEIRATPTFFFLRNGREVDRLVGANKQELQKKTAAFAGPVSRCASFSPQ